MNNRLLTVLLAFPLFACGDKSDTGSDRTSDILSLSGDAAAGETVYTGNCSGCHGADGAGTDSFPPLTGVVASEANINIVLDGISGSSMPAFSSLADQDIADMFAYIETL